MVAVYYELATEKLAKKHLLRQPRVDRVLGLGLGFTEEWRFFLGLGQEDNSSVRLGLGQK